MELNRNDLRYFTGHALTGLLANPLFSSSEGQKYLRMKNLTVELLAVQSALETMECLARMEEQLDRAEKNSAEVDSVTKNMTVVKGE